MGRKALEHKPCRYCGEMFKPRNSTQIYCSGQCQRKSLVKRDREICVCNTCGKEFVLYRTGLKGFYCSRECSFADKENNPMNIHKKEMHRKAEVRKLISQILKDNEKLLKVIETNKRKANRNKQCKECENVFESHYGSMFCSDACRRRYNNRISESRLKKNGDADYTITLNKLYKRDSGVCALCGCVCDYNDCTTVNGVFIAGDKYPSVDHILPISKGGLHQWDNVQLAHRICNSIKSNNI